MINHMKNEKKESFIYSLIKDFWFDFKHDDKLLSHFQKNRWYYLAAIVLSECVLATFVFFASITFASFIGAIEVGSTVLFLNYLPILAGLILAILCMTVVIKFLTDNLTRDWRYYIFKNEIKKFCNPEVLKKFDQRDKSVEINSPATLARTLAVCVSDLLDAGTTIITAVIQFIPCIVILYLIHPYLPLITFFTCAFLLITCYQVAKIMNDSQAKYMGHENQFQTFAEIITTFAQSFSMQPDLCDSRKESLQVVIDDAYDARGEYTVKKSIFNFFATLSKQIVLYGPYLLFGYYAIQSHMSMAEFTLIVNTFIQASSSLMEINQIQTLLVKCNNAKDLYKHFKYIQNADIKPTLEKYTNQDDSVQFSDAKILQIETTAPYKIRIKDDSGRNIVQKFNMQSVDWDDLDPQLLDGKYCISQLDEKPITQPVLFNQSHQLQLKPNQEYVFADNYAYNYKLNFTIPPGKKVLIKGDSGTGKSLIIKAISGNYRVGYGSMFLPDDSQIIHVTQTAIVDSTKTWQEELLASMPENQKKLVNKDQMSSILKKYFGDQKGTIALDQTIGELSGGQEQRFILCRLLLQDPDNIKLITLDEPFGKVDSTSEIQYLKTIYQHFPNATILTISHSDVNNNTAHDKNSILGIHDAKLSVCSLFRNQMSKQDPGATLSEVKYTDLKPNNH